MTTAGDLVAALTAADLGVPVTAPGSSVGTLPAVAVIPADDTMGQGGAFIVHGYDVTVMVSAHPAVAALDELETLTVATVAALVAAGYAIGNRLRYVSGDGEDVFYLGRTIPVAVPGQVMC